MFFNKKAHIIKYSFKHMNYDGVIFRIVRSLLGNFPDLLFKNYSGYRELLHRNIPLSQGSSENGVIKEDFATDVLNT